MKTKREKKLEELIEHYEKELKRTATYLHVHNMSCSDEAAEKGERLRQELALLEEPEASEEDMNGIKERVLEEYKKGNVVYASIEGLMVVPLKEFLEQPTDGLLYDLNRNEAVVLTLIDDPKWVNDFAVVKVIRALRKRIEELNAQQQDKEQIEKHCPTCKFDSENSGWNHQECIGCGDAFKHWQPIEQDKELPDDSEIEQVACDEMQQDWNGFRYRDIYNDGFVDGAKWMRNQK